jgi:hypothetical protein
MRKYFSIKHWCSQIKIGNEHYFKTLKELVPPNLYDLYMGLNKKISLFIFPIVLLTILDRMFFFLPEFIGKIFLITCLLYMLYFGIWEGIISYYTIPNWKRFIVRNSPIQDIASGISLIRTIRSPIAIGCVGCTTFGLGVNELHKALWPDAISPGEKLGTVISSKTGYTPTTKPK